MREPTRVRPYQMPGGRTTIQPKKQGGFMAGVGYLSVVNMRPIQVTAVSISGTNLRAITLLKMQAYQSKYEPTLALRKVLDEVGDHLRSSMVTLTPTQLCATAYPKAYLDRDRDLTVEELRDLHRMRAEYGYPLPASLREHLAAYFTEYVDGTGFQFWLQSESDEEESVAVVVHAEGCESPTLP